MEFKMDGVKKPAFTLLSGRALAGKVGVRRLELPASSSRTTRAANCATPRF